MSLFCLLLGHFSFYYVALFSLHRSAFIIFYCILFCTDFCCLLEPCSFLKENEDGLHLEMRVSLAWGDLEGVEGVEK